MRWRRLPWQGVLILLIWTAGLIVLGIDLSDGHLQGSRGGDLSLSHRPIRFMLVAMGFVVGSLGLLLALVGIFLAWDPDRYRAPLKPSFDDPERRRPM